MAVSGCYPLCFLVFMITAGVSQSKISAVCLLPKVPGPCRYFPRHYYFDVKDGQCLRFRFGFCGKNGNDFQSAQDCRSACGGGTMCSLPKVTGNCAPSKPMYYFNKETGLCEKFEYGGCEGNGNRFTTLHECISTCGGADLCRLPKATGPCQALIPRFYYNAETKECQRFNYGGCHGNANNFNRDYDCQFQCQ